MGALKPEFLCLLFYLFIDMSFAFLGRGGHFETTFTAAVCPLRSDRPTTHGPGYKMLVTSLLTGWTKVISYCITLHQITSHHITSNRLPSAYIKPLHITQPHITLQHAATHHITTCIARHSTAQCSKSNICFGILD